MIQFPHHIDQLTALTQVSELRHRVISHNIANANTPGYQRLDVSFDQELLSRKRLSAAGGTVQPRVEPGEGEEPGLDGNNVDLDQEIGQLNQNAMLFEVYSQLVANHIDMMRRAMQS